MLHQEQGRLANAGLKVLGVTSASVARIEEFLAQLLRLASRQPGQGHRLTNRGSKFWRMLLEIFGAIFLENVENRSKSQSKISKLESDSDISQDLGAKCAQKLQKYAREVESRPRWSLPSRLRQSPSLSRVQRCHHLSSTPRDAEHAVLWSRDPRPSVNR